MNTDSLKAIHHDQVHTQVGWVYKLLAKRHAPADLLAMHEPGPVESKNSVALLNVFCQVLASDLSVVNHLGKPGMGCLESPCYFRDAPLHTQAGRYVDEMLFV